MDFLTLISTGASTEFIASLCANDFLEAILKDPHGWYAQMSHQFVGQCFAVMGLNFNITVRSFSTTHDHPYRNENLSYIFNPPPNALQGFEDFLRCFPTELAHINETLAQITPQQSLEQQFHQLVQPLPCYLQLVLAWCNVVESMCCNIDREIWPIDKFLREPLARVSFCILAGLVKLLPKYAEQLNDLKDICKALLITVRYGLFYVDTHRHILKPILRIFRIHANVFLDADSSGLEFLYYVFMCVMPNNDSYILVFDFLKRMLEQFAAGQQRDANGNLFLRLLTNKLISDRFFAVHSKVLREPGFRHMLLPTLDYLLVLQRHIVTTECFSRRFLDDILTVIIQLSIGRKLAAKLYITLAQRQFDTQEIVAHILETFLKVQLRQQKSQKLDNFLLSLTKYLKSLMQHYEPLQDVNSYMFLFNPAHVKTELSQIAAHAVSVLWDMYMQQYSTDAQAVDQVHKMLDQWSRLLENTRNLDARVRTVLYTIYYGIDFAAVLAHNSQHRQLLMTLERFCLHNFLKDDSLSDVELNRLYESIIRSVHVTHNKQIHETATQMLYDEYINVERSIQRMPDNELLHAYINCMRRLNVLVKNYVVTNDVLLDIYESLAEHTLLKPLKAKRITLYGYETLAFILATLHWRELMANELTHTANIWDFAQRLRSCCCKQLTTVAKLHTAQHINAHCAAIIILQISLRHSWKLDADVYELLLCQLLHIISRPKKYSDTISVSYVKMVFHWFGCLHKYKSIELPNSKIWKLFLHYKSSAVTGNNLMLEVENLIIVMIKHRIINYAHCLSIINMHVGNDANGRKQRVLIEHIRLIEQHATALDAWLLRLYIFNDALQLIDRKLQVPISLDSANNRLLPLKNLLSLIKPLLLAECDFQIAATLLQGMKNMSLTVAEKRSLDAFLNEFSRHKYQCDDERELVFAQLRARPAGPVWQPQIFTQSATPSSGAIPSANLPAEMSSRSIQVDITPTLPTSMLQAMQTTSIASAQPVAQSTARSALLLDAT